MAIHIRLYKLLKAVDILSNYFANDDEALRVKDAKIIVFLFMVFHVRASTAVYGPEAYLEIFPLGPYPYITILSKLKTFSCETSRNCMNKTVAVRICMPWNTGF